MVKVVEDLQDVKDAMYITTVLHRPTVGRYLTDLGCTLVHVSEDVVNSITILRPKGGDEFIWTRPGNRAEELLLSTKGLEIQWTSLSSIKGPDSEIHAKSVGREWIKIDWKTKDPFGEYLYEYYSREIITSMERASNSMEEVEDVAAE